MKIYTFTTLLLGFSLYSLQEISAQSLSNDAAREVSMYLKMMKGSMSVSHSHGKYSFTSTFKHSYQLGNDQDVMGHLPYKYLDLDYSDPHEGLDHGGPISRLTYEITNDAIVLKIYDRVQLTCDFDNSGTEKAPADPFAQYLKCKSGVAQTIEGMILLENGKHVKCSVPSLCNHSKRHMKYDGGESNKRINGRLKRGRSINYYAPWQFVHNQTVTYDLNKISKSQNISKKELAYRLIKNKIIGIVTNEGGVYNDVEDSERRHLVYCLWKLFGNDSDLKSDYTSAATVSEPMSKEQLLARANDYIKKGKEAVQAKERDKAIELFESAAINYKEAILWSTTEEQKQQIYESYMSSLRMQTFNAYRLMKTTGRFKDTFERNYDYFVTSVRYDAPTHWITLENGLGVIALEIKAFDEAENHFQMVLNEITDNPDRSLVAKVKIFLAQAYIGGKKKKEAATIVDEVLDELPDNKEAVECKRLIGNM